MVQDLSALSGLLLAVFLESRLLDGLRTRLGLLLVDIGVDQLKVTVVSSNPGRRRAMRRRSCVADGVVCAGRVVEDEGPVPVDRGFPDTITSTSWDGIGCLATMVSTSSIDWRLWAMSIINSLRWKRYRTYSERDRGLVVSKRCRLAGSLRG